MAVPPPPSKAALRRALRLARARFADGDLAPGAALMARLLPLIDGVRIVGGYVAHRGEPDILPMLRAAIASGRGAALPRASDADGMRFVGWRSEDRLSPGDLGIPEPGDGMAIVPDLVLAPLLGFDRQGRRLGQGGGHYDRWFATHPGARRIGVAWSIQEEASIPEEPWDIRLHAIVTERETIVP